MDSLGKIDQKLFIPTNPIKTIFEREQELLVSYTTGRGVNSYILGTAIQRLTIPINSIEIYYGLLDTCSANSLSTITDSQLREVINLEW